jgi:hypothetical protein
MRSSILAAAVALASGLTPADAVAANTFVLAHDRTDTTGAVHVFKLKGNGDLVAEAGSPFAAPGGNFEALVDADTLAFWAKRKVLVVDGGDRLYSFKVAASGALLPAPGSPLVTGMTQHGVAIVERGERAFAIASDLAAEQIRSFEIGNDGSLAATGAVANFAVGADPSGFAVDGKLLFVLKSGAGAIDKFEIGTDGQIGPPSFVELDVPVPVAARTLAMTPDDESLYLAATDEPWIGFMGRIGGDEQLTALAKVPFDPTAAFALGGLAVSNSRVAAFRRGDDGLFDVLVMKRDKKHGLLLPLANLQSSGIQQVEAMAFDADSSRLMVATGTFQGLRSFDVASGTGQLIELDTQPLPGASTITDVLVIER